MGHVGIPLASSYEASLESEYPTDSCNRQRLTKARECLHQLHQGWQSHKSRSLMQGVIKAFDPDSGLGLVITDTDLAEYELADNALEGSIFRMLRQGQRVVFTLDAEGRATSLRLGSESDMGTPGYDSAPN